jgi:hypothetical protein
MPRRCVAPAFAASRAIRNVATVRPALADAVFVKSLLELDEEHEVRIRDGCSSKERKTPGLPSAQSGTGHRY